MNELWVPLTLGTCSVQEMPLDFGQLPVGDTIGNS